MLRGEVKAETVVPAVAKAIEAKFSRSDWIELGLLTGVGARITNHRRLLRSLDFGDDDYFGHVADMVPFLLGDEGGSSASDGPVLELAVGSTGGLGVEQTDGV